MRYCNCGGIIVKEVKAYETQRVGDYWAVIAPIAADKRTYVIKCIKCGTIEPQEVPADA